jgi:hypothetical protein
MLPEGGVHGLEEEYAGVIRRSSGLEAFRLALHAGGISVRA